MFPKAGTIFFDRREQLAACLPQNVAYQEASWALDRVCGHLVLCLEGLDVLVNEKPSLARDEALTRLRPQVVDLERLADGLSHLAVSQLHRTI